MLATRNKINVMHAVISLEIGGLEKIVSDMILGIDKERFNMEVCCFVSLGELAEKLKENNIDVNLLKITKQHYDIFYPYRLSKFLREKKTDILHMHSGTFFLGTQAGIMARMPAMIYTDHGRHLIDPKKLIMMNRISALFVDKIVAVSKELEDYLVNVVKLSRRKTTTIINGIDTVKYSPRSKPLHLLKEFGIAEQTKVIGTVGRLAEVKDQRSMIAAFGIVNRKFPDSVLMLVGDGPRRGDLEEYANSQGVRNKVIFTGSRNDISEVLNVFDIFLLTSLSEGTSISLLEAMASGVAPVVTDVGGNSSIVLSEKNGFLVKPKDISSIANGMLKLISLDNMRLSISRNAVDTVASRYSIGNMIEKYQTLYDQLMQI